MAEACLTTQQTKLKPGTATQGMVRIDDTLSELATKFFNRMP